MSAPCSSRACRSSATLFVVEEASSHFSVALLWRTFTAATVALWARQLLMSSYSYSINGHASKSFQITFETGTGDGCTLPTVEVWCVLLLAGLGGVVGAAFNAAVLYVNKLRTRLLRGRKPFLALDALVVVLLTTSACVLLPELFPCRDKTVGSLEYNIRGGASEECGKLYAQCGGRDWKGITCCQAGLTCEVKEEYYSQCEESKQMHERPLNSACMTEEFKLQIAWTNATASTCEDSCLRATVDEGLDMLVNTGNCNGLSQYSPLGSLLLQSAEETVKALFLRGAPEALPVPELAVAFCAWFILTALAAGLFAPLGLMIPMIIIGGCFGRLYALLLAQAGALATGGGTWVDPGLFALFGATAVMAGSGQIRVTPAGLEPAQPRPSSVAWWGTTCGLTCSNLYVAAPLAATRCTLSDATNASRSSSSR